MSTIATDPELLLRQMSAYALDYDALTRDVFGWTPRPWQSDVLFNPKQNRLLATHRQAGKTETVSALAAATTISALQPGAVSLIVSTGQTHAADIMRRISKNIRAAEQHGLCNITEQSKHHIVLEDGSRCFSVASTETATRGWAISGVLLIDEAAFIPDPILTALFPTVAAAGGSVLLMSTPNGKSGMFSQMYHDDDPSWHITTVKASDPNCSLDAEFLEQQKRVLGVLKFSQEYEVSFVDNDLAGFGFDTIERAFGGADGTPWGVNNGEDQIISTDNPFAGAF